MKSVINYKGMASILLDADGHRDSLGVIQSTGATSVKVISKKEDAIDKEGAMVIIVQGPVGVLWALPVDDKGQVTNGMFGGAWIYSSDSRFPSVPVRLMDRVEY